MHAAITPGSPWVTAHPDRGASSAGVIMYRPGMVPAPMPETGGRECGSPGPGRYSAQSYRSRVTEAGALAGGPRPAPPAIRSRPVIPGAWSWTRSPDAWPQALFPGKRDYTVLAPLRPRSGDNRFLGLQTGIAVTARGTGGQTPARQGGSAGRPPGSFLLDQLTRPGETQYDHVEHNFDVSRTESRLGADQRSRVLVTGGSGFIGRRLVAALLAGGADVTVADRHEPSAPGVRFVDGDLRDPAIAAQAVSPGTEVIVHLAAVTSVLRSVEDPAGTFEANVAATAC